MEEKILFIICQFKDYNDFVRSLKNETVAGCCEEMNYDRNKKQAENVTAALGKLLKNTLSDSCTVFSLQIIARQMIFL